MRLTDLADQHQRFSIVVRLVERTSHLVRSGGHRLRGVVLDLRLGAVSEVVVRNEDRLSSQYSDHHYYEAVRASHFYEALSCVELERRSSTFMDLGSGLGRPLLLAAESGFGCLVGAELDESLITQAQRNIDRWRGRHRPESDAKLFTLLHQDAASVEFPPDPLMVFLANPFGEQTLGQVLDNLVLSYNSKPRSVWLCYVNPVFDGLLRERPQFTERGRADMWVVYHLRPRTGDGRSRS